MAHPTEYSTEVSVPLPSDESIKALAGEVGVEYDPAKALNVMKMLAGTEDMFAATAGLVEAVFEAKGIDPKTREMIILRAAKLLNCPYEWQANAVFAKNAGLSSDEIDAAAGDGPVTGINPEYVLICRVTDELSITATLSDATLSEMLRKYGPTICRKLILMISWFNLLSRFLNGCRVPLETVDKIGNKTSPL